VNEGEELGREGGQKEGSSISWGRWNERIHESALGEGKGFLSFGLMRKKNLCREGKREAKLTEAFIDGWKLRPTGG